MSALPIEEARIIKMPERGNIKIVKTTPKKRGKKSEVYPYELNDMKNMIGYFEEHEMWLHYLLFIMSCNMARRIGDMLSLTWEHIYDPQTGNIRRDILEIREDKTDKLANPRINSAVKSAIEKYIEKTGCDPKKNNYHEYVFMQLSGTHAGKVVSDDGHRKALKKAASAVGITYNVGTHSARKTFGKMSRMLHPNDYDSMELLQTIYNHSDTRVTKHYIGLTKEKVDKYYDDMGEFFTDYVTGDCEYQQETKKTVVSIDVNDLRQLIALAISEGRNIKEDSQMLETANDLYEIMDSLVK